MTNSGSEDDPTHSGSNVLFFNLSLPKSHDLFVPFFRGDSSVRCRKNLEEPEWLS